MEYKITRAEFSELEAHLNHWAARGWRVLSVQRMAGFLFVIVWERKREINA